MTSERSAAPSSASGLGPNIRILFDRTNHRLQITNFRHELWRWDGDAWYYVPFIQSDLDFLKMAKLLAQMVGARAESERGISLGPMVSIWGWPASVLSPKTAIAYHQESGQIEIHHPDPTLGIPPNRHDAHFLRQRDSFQLWAIMVGKLAGLAPRPVPEHGAGKVDHRVTMFCFC